MKNIRAVSHSLRQQKNVIGCSVVKSFHPNLCDQTNPKNGVIKFTAFFSIVFYFRFEVVVSQNLLHDEITS